MDNINFLSNQDGRKAKKKKQDKSRVQWSEPIKEKVDIPSKKDYFFKPGKLSSWFALPKKEKKEPISPRSLNIKNGNGKNNKRRPASFFGVWAERPEPAIQPGAGSSPIKPSVKSGSLNNEKVDFFRQKVLKAIKDNGSKKSAPEPLKAKEFIKEKPRYPKGEFRTRIFPWLEKIISIFARKRKIIKPYIISEVIQEDKKSILPASGEEKKEWEAPHILETNLIKGEFIAFFQLKKNIIILIFFITLACLAVAGIYGGLILFDKQETKKETISLSPEKINALNEKITKLEDEINKKSLLNNDFKLANKLLNEHIYWTNFFKFLEDITIPDIYYSGISFDNKGEYSLSARAKNFRMILDQVNIMRLNEYVKSVMVNSGQVSIEKKTGKENKTSKEAGANASESKVDFTLKISVDPVLFTKGPHISSIEPLEGAVGQYITVSGINFGSYKAGKSIVKFYNSQSEDSAPADISFPAECQNDWWSNSNIIVKVPSLALGNWRIIVVNEDGEAEYSNNFQITSGSIGPGICLLSPSYGTEEQAIDIYGENFGQKQGTGSVEYSGGGQGKIIDWSGQKITVAAPMQVQSGMLHVKISSGQSSNGFLYKRLY